MFSNSHVEQIKNHQSFNLNQIKVMLLLSNEHYTYSYKPENSNKYFIHLFGNLLLPGTLLQGNFKW